MTTHGRQGTRGAVRVPPRIATWLLLSWGAGPFTESLAGDLMEEYQCGRSGYWYWRQVAAAVALARTRWLRMTAWSMADRLVAAFALIALGLGTLTWANVVKSDAESTRQPLSTSARCVAESSDCSTAPESPLRGRP